MSILIPNDPAPTLEDIWRLFRETDLRFKETDRKFQESAREFQETKQLLKQQSEEFRKEMQQRDKEFNDRFGRLTNRLGDFVEGLVKPSIIRLFQERGINVHVVTRDVRAKNPELGLEMEIDLLVINGDSCVLIEVKSNLGIEDVNEHLKRMSKFKPLFPVYADKKIYGAVTGMVIEENVAKYAYRKGFFVIAQKGDTAVILNDQKFKPKAW
jgi:hypothetical protein